MSRRDDGLGSLASIKALGNLGAATFAGDATKRGYKTSLNSLLRTLAIVQSALQRGRDDEAA